MPVRKSLCFFLLGLLAPCAAELENETSLADDDECMAGAAEAEGERCSLSALQRRGIKMLSEAEEEGRCGSLDDPRNAACKKTIGWLLGGGKYDKQAPTWFRLMKGTTGVDHLHATKDDFQRQYFCHPAGHRKCGVPPCACSRPPCWQCHADAAQQPTPRPAQPSPPPNGQCASLDDPSNGQCKSTIKWLARGGKNDPKAPGWFKDMPRIVGVDHMRASQDDFQRLYFCKRQGGKQCGKPPCACTKPPCWQCDPNQKSQPLLQPEPTDGKCASTRDPRNAECRSMVNWAQGSGKWDPKALSWFSEMPMITGVDHKKATADDFQRLYFCEAHDGKKCGTLPCKCTYPPCDMCGKSGDESGLNGQCGTVDDERNAGCKKTLNWLVSGGGRNDKKARSWFNDMVEVTGVGYKNATIFDFQRLYFCAPHGGKACGAPPCICSKPPCWQCYKGQMARPRKKVCDGPDASIADISQCPPKTPMGYKGREWPAMTFYGQQQMHIFAIGDWGGMDGTLKPIEGRPNVVAYKWGVKPGPSVFPRTRWNQAHTVELCSHKEFIACFNSRGGEGCPAGCGYIGGIDDQPQQLVANAFQKRAKQVDPGFILNVGDNFYWGGIEKTCGTNMNTISYTAHHQFDQVFDRVYTGMGKRKWLSVLGNHDWGGRVFNNGWDQQIAYTWANPKWVMPAPYWWQHVDYPDQNFSVDIYMLDSNFVDAKDPEEDPEHNLCGSKHNDKDANCSIAGGPASIESCPEFFANLWAEQKEWVTNLMMNSTATWRLVVTHFPCGHEQAFYKMLHQDAGLDLLITGHRHDQELWLPSMHWKNFMGGLTCIVTGGGGGITSEATPNPKNTTDWYGEAQYGFFDLSINKTEIFIQSINYNDTVMLSTHVYPKVQINLDLEKHANVGTNDASDADASDADAPDTWEVQSYWWPGE